MRDSDHLVAQSHLELEQRIRERAHQIWLSRTQAGAQQGDFALDDWLQAEREVLGDDPKNPALSRSSTVGDAHTPDFSRIEQLGEA